MKGEKCNCDKPHREYGTIICLNCGGILDFKDPDGSEIES